MKIPSLWPFGVPSIAGLALYFAGCASNVNTFERAESLAEHNHVVDQRVVTDRTLARTFHVVSINQDSVSGNLLRVQATVANLKNRVRTLNYKFEWIDNAGMAIDSPNETWKSIRFQGRETRAITTVAVSPRAVDFRLKFRE